MKSDGSTAKYYELPEGATELQHLISAKDMNAQMGEIFRACFRYGEVDHSDQLRDAKKIKFYIEAEIERLLAMEPKIHNFNHGLKPGEAYIPCDNCNDAPKAPNDKYCQHCRFETNYWRVKE